MLENMNVGKMKVTITCLAYLPVYTMLRDIYGDTEEYTRMVHQFESRDSNMLLMWRHLDKLDRDLIARWIITHAQQPYFDNDN